MLARITSVGICANEICLILRSLLLIPPCTTTAANKYVPPHLRGGGDGSAAGGPVQSELTHFAPPYQPQQGYVPQQQVYAPQADYQQGGYAPQPAYQPNPYQGGGGYGHQGYGGHQGGGYGGHQGGYGGYDNRCVAMQLHGRCSSSAAHELLQDSAGSSVIGFGHAVA